MIRALIRSTVPAPLRRAIRQRLYGTVALPEIAYTGSYASWQEARAASKGYDAPSILEKTLRAALQVKRGEAAFERDSVTFGRLEHRHSLVAALLHAASGNRGRLTVVDFGGALGSSYFQHRRYLDRLESVKWRVVEQAHYVEAGIRELADERLSFHADLQSACAGERPDVLLLSAVLAYLEDPWAVLKQVLEVRAPLLVVDRTLVLDALPTRLTVQHVPARIYAASYPCWVFNEAELVGRVAGYELMDEYLAHPGIVEHLGDANAVYKGYTFRLPGAGA